MKDFRGTLIMKSYYTKKKKISSIKSNFKNKLLFY